MREFAYTLMVLASGLLLSAAFLFLGDDRSTFVPPPEAAAENFVRLIATRRFDLAMNHLANETRRVETARTLASRFDALFARSGKINQVDAEPQWMQQDHASARARIDGDAGVVSFDVGLVRENGLWRIAQLPDLVR